MTMTVENHNDGQQGRGRGGAVAAGQRLGGVAELGLAPRNVYPHPHRLSANNIYCIVIMEITTEKGQYYAQL